MSVNYYDGLTLTEVPGTSPTLAKNGFGYGICSTAAATIAKVATMDDYILKKNGYVSVKFINAVPAYATLNINSKGEKPIYYRGAAIGDKVIGAGDLATFVYDGTNYELIGVDNGKIYNGNVRKVICIGDSYLGGSGRPYAESESWGAFVRLILNNGSDTIIKGMGGSGFIGQPTVADYTYIKQLEEVVNEMSADERYEVSDILVQGGLNDKYGLNHGTYTELDIQNAISEFTSYAHTKFPNAMVRIGVVGWATDGLSDKINFPKIMNLYKNTFGDECYNRLQYMSGIEYIMPTAPDSEYYDSTHPDVNMSYRIAKAMVNCMQGGGGDICISVANNSLTLTLNENMVSSTTDIKYSIYNGLAQINCPNFWFSYTTPVTYSFGSYIEIASITGGEPIRASIPIYIPCFVWGLDENNVEVQLPSMVKLQSKKFYLMLDVGTTAKKMKEISIKMGTYSDSVFNLC